MSLKVTIVNTSNWTNEELLVTVGDCEPVVLKDMQSLDQGLPLDGEMTFTVRKAGKRFGQEKPAPRFDESGRQVYPTVKCVLEAHSSKEFPTEQ